MSIEFESRGKKDGRSATTRDEAGFSEERLGSDLKIKILRRDQVLKSTRNRNVFGRP